MNCPRCNGHNTIFKAAIKPLATDVSISESCDALWTHPDTIGPHTAVPLHLFLGAQHVTASLDLLTEGELDALRGEDSLSYLET